MKTISTFKKSLLMLAFALATTTLMAQITYTITAGSVAGTFSCAQASSTNLPIANVINNIRVNAAGAACTIQFGSGSALNLNTTAAEFDGSSASPPWGKVTITGSVTGSTGSGSGVIVLKNGASITSSANIANTGGFYAIRNEGTGTLTITGGTVSVNASGTAINNSSTGAVVISGGTVSSAQGRAIYVYNGTVTVSGAAAVVTSDNTEDSNATVYVYGGTFEMSSGTVRNTSSSGNAIYKSSSGTVNIKGGDVWTNAGAAIVSTGSSGKTTISDGTIRSSATDVNKATILISGGVFEMSGGTVSNTNTNASTRGNVILITSTNGPHSISGGSVTAGVNTAIRHNGVGALTISGNAQITSSNQNSLEATIILKISSGTSRHLDISGGTVSNTVGAGVRNDGNGRIEVSSGQISGYVMAINNVGDGNINITGGTVKATYASAIDNMGSGNIDISGGTVSTTGNVEPAIYNYKNGKITISGSASITSSNPNTSSYPGAIHLSNNSTATTTRLIIDGGTVSNTASGGYAIYNISAGPVEFTGGGTFNGIIGGTGNVIKSGGLKLTMSAAHPATGTFTLEQGGILNFSGSWGGNFIQKSVSELEVNKSMTVGGTLTLQGGTINMNLSTSPASQLKATGACIASGTTGINISPVPTPANQVLIQAASGVNASNFECPVANLTSNGTQLMLSPSATPVIWQRLEANGYSVETTSELNLIFDKPIVGLAASNISVTGATKGTLSGSGQAYVLKISNITVANGQNVTVNLTDPAGYTISPKSMSVAVTVIPLCEIVETGVKYQSLDAALAAANGKTIRMLQIIEQAELRIDNIKTTFDTNGKTLSVGFCQINNTSEIKLQGLGAFNLTQDGIWVWNGSKATVSNVSGTNGVEASTSEITITGNVDISGARSSAVAAGANSKITVLGNVTTTGASSYGAEALNGGQITIDGKITVPTGATYIRVGTTNKTAANFTTPTTKTGYLTYTDGTSTVWVKDASAAPPVCEIVETGVKYSSLAAALAANNRQTIRLLENINYNNEIEIDDNVVTFALNNKTLTATACYAINASQIKLQGTGEFNSTGGVLAGPDSKITITNVTGNDGIGTTGGEITVLGNVTLTGSSVVGATASSGGKITIDGKLTVPNGATYIRVGTTNKTAANYEPAIDKPGYLTYTDGTNKVWVKGEPAVTTVNWTGLTANGTSNSVTTTELTLTFDKEPGTLAASNITVTGATKGALSGTGTTRKLAITNITVANGQNVTVTLTDPAGYTFTSKSKTVAVYVAAPVKTVTVDPQSATVTAGTGGVVTFPVRTANIGNSAYPVTLSGAPSGVTAANLTIAANAGTLTLNVPSSVAANTYTLTITIDGATSPGFSLVVSPATALEVVEQQVLKAWMQNGVLYVSGLTPGKSWSVYNLSGQLVYQAIAKTEEANISLAAQGIYIVAANGNRVKVVKQ